MSGHEPAAKDIVEGRNSVAPSPPSPRRPVADGRRCPFRQRRPTDEDLPVG